MGTRTAIADTIVRRRGDGLLAPEADRPATHDGVARSFADPPPGPVHATLTTTDADHGRVEERRHVVCRDVAWIWSDRRCADEPRFLHLAMVETRVERVDKVQSERRHDPSSTRSGARAFADRVRTHRHIENRLRRMRGIALRDDLAGLRTGYRPGTMAVVRHCAMNLVRAAGDKHGLKLRREKANLDTRPRKAPHPPRTST